jgi:hypothetical protein
LLLLLLTAPAPHAHSRRFSPPRTAMASCVAGVSGRIVLGRGTQRCEPGLGCGTAHLLGAAARRRHTAGRGARLRVSAADASAGAGTPRPVVAVTGATGFVGSKLCQELVRRGAAVRVLTRDTASARRKLQPALGAQSVQYYAVPDWGAAVRGATR